jgi:hypothetical protein
VDTCTNAHAYVCATHTHTHTHTNIHLHAHTHTRTHAQLVQVTHSSRRKMTRAPARASRPCSAVCRVRVRGCALCLLHRSLSPTPTHSLNCLRASSIHVLTCTAARRSDGALGGLSVRSPACSCAGQSIRSKAVCIGVYECVCMCVCACVWMCVCVCAQHAG